MDLSEVKRLQRECEASILEALRTFQRQTELNVMDIDFDEVRIVGSRQKDVIGVRLRVELP